MSAAVAIGDELRLAGYAVAGVDVLPAASAAEAEAAFARLPDQTGLVILTSESRAALEALLAERDDIVWAEVPE